jgi:hypothetical protein
MMSTRAAAFAMTLCLVASCQRAGKQDSPAPKTGGESMKADIGMIVQLRLTGRWGTDKEMQVRDELAEALDAGLRRLGLGDFDGTDVGSGTTNLFIYHIPADRWDQAVEFVLSELRKRDLLEKARVVRSVMKLADDESIPEHKVIWPRGFRGEFSIFTW